METQSSGESSVSPTTAYLRKSIGTCTSASGTADTFMSCSIKELRKCRAVINELRELSINVSRGIDKVLKGADPEGLHKLSRPLTEILIKTNSLIANKKGDLKVQVDSTPCECISLRTQVSDLMSFIAPAGNCVLENQKKI